MRVCVCVCVCTCACACACVYVSLSLGYAYVLFVCLASKPTFSEGGKYVSPPRSMSMA